ncbi:MAG: diacylglycerol kinase family lipid kinase [Pyrinomonadaceae bacterium]|nr:diacylglycerol kinase family lipid kinase [Pyrinomonadaceae bacterium]
MDARPPRMLVIVNHVAAKARRAWPAIKSILTENEIEFETHVTTRAGDATDAARAALRAGCELVAVVGGDGTLSEAASGFFALDESVAIGDVPSQISSKAALAILPAGTGDDFARGLRGGREPLESWASALVNYCRSPHESKTRVVDVIYGSANDGANSFICINVVTVGLGAQVAGRVAAQGRMMQSLPGEARFVAAACGALLAWRERTVRVSVDEDEAIECRSNLLAVANGIYAGGGMMFAPAARVDDGKLDVLVSCNITRATILRELPRIRRGAHLSNPNVRAIAATRVSIETSGDDNALPIEADGNVRGQTPARFRIMPGALRIVL